MDSQDLNDPRRLAARRTLRRSGVQVLLEDNHLLCLSKPAGLLSQGGPEGQASLTDLLDAYRRAAEGKSGRAYIGLVHRLDRNTSGAMVVAKTSKAASRLSQALRDRRAEKVYLAWVDRPAREDEGTLEHWLRREGGVTRLAADGDTDRKRARLSYEVEGRSHRASRVRIRLETGLTHQIRVQMAQIGHPLVGDPKYGGSNGKRPGLHALELHFEHPVRKTPVVLTAPIPEDLLKMDARLGIQPPV